MDNIDQLLNPFYHARKPFTQSWVDFFIDVAVLASSRSKDESTKVGCVLVDPESMSPLTFAYNGVPRHISENPDHNIRPEKYFWWTHAEQNAIANCARLGIKTDGSYLFLTQQPCSDCVRLIIQAGIDVVVVQKTEEWQDYDTRWFESISRGRLMLNEAAVILIWSDGKGIE